MSMKKSFKAIALVGALVLVVGLVAMVAVLNYDDPNNPKPGLFVNDKRVRNPGTIVTVGGNEIGFDEYRFYFFATKSNLTQSIAQGDATFWDEDPDGQKTALLKSSTEQNLQYTYGWLQIAAEKGVGLTEEEMQQIDDNIQKTKDEQGGKFTDWLRQANIANEQIYRKLSMDQTLSSKIQSLYPEMESENYAQYDQEILDTAVSAEHILIKFAEVDPEAEDQQAAQAQVEADALALANTIYGDLTEAEDPAALFEEYRPQYDDDKESQPAGGYTFVEGQMMQEFYDAAKNLAVGDFSQPVRTSYGYHIILRKPLDEQYVEENRDSLTGAKRQEMMNEDISTYMAAIPVVGGKYYEQITVGGVR